MQTKWASIINPLLSKPMLQGQNLENVTLVTGTNIINHKLGRKLQGWTITDIDAAVTVYRSAPMNDLTLTLTSSGNATANIWVF